MDVADALRNVATSMAPSESLSTDALTTPQRRTAAIRVVTKDKNLMREEQVRVMRLFQEDMAIAHQQTSDFATNNTRWHKETQTSQTHKTQNIDIILLLTLNLTSPKP